MKASSVSSIRNNIHHLIDKIDDIKLLENFYALLNHFKENETEGKIYKSLSNEQKEEVLKSYKDSEDDENLVTLKEFKEKYKKWLSK